MSITVRYIIRSALQIPYLALLAPFLLFLSVNLLLVFYFILFHFFIWKYIDLHSTSSGGSPLPSSCFTGELLQNSERQELKYQDQEASLRVPCAYKEDEGFYTIRIPSLGGCKEQTTYVFVQGNSRMLSYSEQKLLS